MQFLNASSELFQRTFVQDHIVGQGKALEITMTGRKVTAEECYRIGLCERIVPDGTTREAAEELAQEIN